MSTWNPARKIPMYDGLAAVKECSVGTRECVLVFFHGIVHVGLKKFHAEFLYVPMNLRCLHHL